MAGVVLNTLGQLSIECEPGPTRLALAGLCGPRPSWWKGGGILTPATRGVASAARPADDAEDEARPKEECMDPNETTEAVLLLTESPRRGPMRGGGVIAADSGNDAGCWEGRGETENSQELEMAVMMRTHCSTSCWG
mgnify:CR=1 FL=1